MTLELENKVVGASLYEPELFLRHELHTDWLFDTKNKQVIEALNRLDGKYNDFSEVIAAMKADDPYCTWSEDGLEMLSFKYHELNDYQTGIRLLKRRYFEEKVRQATERYSEQPTKGNLHALQDRLRELDEAEEVEDDGGLDDPVADLLDKLENGSPDGLVAYPEFDRVLGGGMRGGQLITIGARPSVGKTAYAVNLAVQLLTNNDGMQVDFFTLEMSKNQMLDRFISRLSDVSSYKLRMPKVRLNKEEKERIVTDALLLQEKGLRIYDNMYTIGQIEKQIRRRVHETKGKPYVAFIDYIGLIETANKRMDRHLQVGEITRTFKKLTNHLDIPIIELSQLNRSVENRQDKTPNLSDLRESGSVEQDSNVVGFLYRDPDDENVVKLNIAKNREGMTFTIDYRFLGQKMYFEELS